MSVTPDSLALPHPGLGDGQCVTVSIGLSLDVKNGDEAGFLALVRQADDALYRAKEEGAQSLRRPLDTIDHDFEYTAGLAQRMNNPSLVQLCEAAQLL